MIFITSQLLYGQETAFSYINDHALPSQIKVNSQHRCYAYKNWFTEDGWQNSITYFDLDNVVHYHYPDWWDGPFFGDFALFGAGIGILETENYNNFYGFRWRYWEDPNVGGHTPYVSSPGENIHPIDFSQIDETYCAVLFRYGEEGDNHYIVYNLDVNANVIWSCEIPTTPGGLNDGTTALVPYQFAQIDSSRFVISASAPGTDMHVMTFDNTGIRTADSLIVVNSINYTNLNQTTPPGAVMLTYYSGGHLKVDKIDETTHQNILSLDCEGMLNGGTSVTTDSNYITLFLNVPGEQNLNLFKYTWSGEYVNHYNSLHNMSFTGPGCFVLTPDANYFCATHTIVTRILADDFTVGNEENTNPLPAQLTASPNPFTSGTTLTFESKQNQSAKITIFNIKGQTIRNLPERQITAGTNNAFWDGKDAQGRAVSNGLYFIQVQTQDWSQVLKCLCLRR